MATNSLVAVKRRELNVYDLDKRTQRELVAHTNRMLAQVELGREAMQAISETFVYSEYQVSLALTGTKAIEDRLAHAGIPAQEYVPINRTLQGEYLQNVATVVHKVVNAISRLVG